MNAYVSKSFVPMLRTLGMALDPATYQRVDPLLQETFCLAQIADFNTLIATSQKHQTPVFALEDDMFGHVGKVLDQDKEKRDEFEQVFHELANTIMSLAT